MRGSRLGLLAAMGLVIAGGAGCGAGDSGDACAKVQPCGGDLVGTWQLSSACASQPPLPGKLCAAATVVYASFSIAGTETFEADLSYSLSATTSGTIQVSVPTSCLVVGDATMTCAQITPQVSAEVNVRCVDSAAGCDCTFVLLQTDLRATGTYTTSGTSLNETPGGRRALARTTTASTAIGSTSSCRTPPCPSSATSSVARGSERAQTLASARPMRRSQRQWEPSAPKIPSCAT